MPSTWKDQTAFCAKFGFATMQFIKDRSDLSNILAYKVSNVITYYAIQAVCCNMDSGVADNATKIHS